MEEIEKLTKKVNEMEQQIKIFQMQGLLILKLLQEKLQEPV